MKDDVNESSEYRSSKHDLPTPARHKNKRRIKERMHRLNEWLLVSPHWIQKRGKRIVLTTVADKKKFDQIIIFCCTWCCSWHDINRGRAYKTIFTRKTPCQRDKTRPSKKHEFCFSSDTCSWHSHIFQQAFHGAFWPPNHGHFVWEKHQKCKKHPSWEFLTVWEALIRLFTPIVVKFACLVDESGMCSTHIAASRALPCPGPWLCVRPSS